jgi:hypothetical protein
MTSNGTEPSTSTATDRTTPGHSVEAIASILYLLLALALMGWLLFDTWIDRHTLAGWAGYDLSHLQKPGFHLVAYTLIGGAMGGILNGIRSVLIYYVGFDRQYLWKYIAAPWMGAALALLGYALLRSTVAVLGGQGTGVQANTSQMLANFAIGALAGYGAKDVFIWLDAQVGKLFGVPVSTPDVQGKSEGTAVGDIQAQQLAVGSVTTVPTDVAAVGTVVNQAPAPDTTTMRGDPVNLTVAIAPPATDDPASPSPPADDPSGTASPAP